MAEMVMAVRNFAPPSALLPTSSASNAWSRESRIGRPETDSLESQVSHLVQWPSLKFHVTKFRFSATESRKLKALSQ
eukprot:4412621-Pleurochrysis_carterae.AAC.1